MTTFSAFDSGVNGESAVGRSQRLYQHGAAMETQPALEHLSLLASIKSARFYRRAKSYLSPFLPAIKGVRPASRRMDFTRKDYNQIFEIAAKFWDCLPDCGNVSIPSAT